MAHLPKERTSCQRCDASPLIAGSTPPQLIVDRAVQRGTKNRPAMLATRKNNEAYVLDLTQDIVDAIRWHIR
jgi:hypothetical protein